MRLPTLSNPRLLRGRRRKALIVNGTLLVVAVVGGVLAYRSVHSTQPAAAVRPATRTATVSTGAVTATVSASGTVASANVASADFITAGTVTEIDAKVGDPVTKGQVLAKVDPAEANENLTVAKAKLTAANQALAADQSASADTTTISNDQSSVSQAQSTVDTAQAAVGGTVLTAPIAGTVTALTGTVGNSSAAGFMEISDLAALQVSVSVPESDATKLKAGQSASISWTALSGTTATGTLASVSPTATASDGVNSYAAVVSLASAPDGVRLGQSVTASITVASADNVLRVPSAAVQSAGGKHTVQVQGAGGAASTVTVQVGVLGDSYVQITSGLTADQVVLLTVQATATSTSGTGGFPGGGNFPGGGAAAGGGGPGGVGG
jgi:macrolide-specific efflux system membrane fusion protein